MEMEHKIYTILHYLMRKWILYKPVMQSLRINTFFYH
jgi:hypothetical protein